MSLKKRLIKNTALNSVGYLYLVLASFFSIPIFLNKLGSELFGTYILLAAIVPLVSILDFGLGKAVVRSLSLHQISKKEKTNIWQTSLFLYLVSGILILLGVLSGLSFIVDGLRIFEKIGRPEIDNIIIVLAITSLFNHLNSHFLTIPQVKERFDIYNLKTFFVGTGNTVISAIIVSYVPSLFLVFLAQLFFHILTSMSLIFYASRLGLSFLPKFNFVTAKELISFGLKYFIGVASSQVKQQFSKYALGAMLSVQSITIFSIPQNIILKAAAFIQQLSLALFPMSASLLTKNRIGKLKKLISITQLTIFVLGLIQLAIVYLLGHQFLSWWLKDEFIASQAFSVFKVLSIFFVFTTLAPVPTVVLQSLNYPQIPSFFSFFSTILYIILVLYLTPRYQVLGPAYALVLTSALTVPAFLIAFYILFNSSFKKIEKGGRL